MQALGNFTFYDYNEPEDVPDALRNSFGVVIADPPYLVRDARPACLHHGAQSYCLSSKPWPSR